MFLSLLTKCGRRVEPSKATLDQWRLIIGHLRHNGVRPYMSINVAVIRTVEDATEQQKYRTVVNETTEMAEPFALVDHQALFWADWPQYVDDTDEKGMMQHLHTTLSRQRVVLRLCPKTDNPWSSMETAANSFFENVKMDTQPLQVDRTAEPEIVSTEDNDSTRPIASC